ncbi:(R,R)-butanediol dehydrogenase/meso-butanediol dehydrogenase/diacetyl reductase [Pseudonocardia hierapolitana]|uniref:(R,R)-butanediol dehydrogenase/meso-butanediol dehydrogenase/diacetyl reductase n=1 Tax=Pseudonocardia hierapolitana TaxID=1128676 RepID=A0A561SZM4_9PSEU|nr:alcohol dehydrogenase catalytic domain-containing protein [Pseudonocardia hierapolitana]TWF80326.1 (R,R)-butanediol dehydrogenase/meso-butanediol dehydrogenase/diacetyl reductase [Pseudonocardia hierapolitana]
MTGGVSGQAVRWYGPKDLRLEAVHLPAPRAGDVLVRVAYCGVCGSDLHEVADGPHAIPVDRPHSLSGAVAPLTLGHEFSGVVAATGTGVEGLPVGAPVAVEPNYRCWRCPACREGRTEVCAGFGFAGLMGDGGMAEYALVPSYMVHRLPDGFDLAVAAVLEPAAVALHGIRRSAFDAGQTAVVVGLGPVGLIVCALLREAGAACVVGVDPVPARREMGRRFGVDAALAPDADVAAALEQLTGGDRAHVAFEVVGSQAAVGVALSSVRSGGELLLLGLVDELTLPAYDMVNAELRVTTSVGYRGCHPELIRLVTRGRLDLAALVSDVVALADAPAALLDMAAGAPTAIKTLVRCGEDR